MEVLVGARPDSGAVVTVWNAGRSGLGGVHYCVGLLSHSGPTAGSQKTHSATSQLDRNTVMDCDIKIQIAELHSFPTYIQPSQAVCSGWPVWVGTGTNDKH